MKQPPEQHSPPAGSAMAVPPQSPGAQQVPSWQVLRSAIDSPPVMTSVLGGPLPVRIDHYTMQFPGVRSTTFPTPLLLVHLDGAPVTVRASGSDSVRNTRGCFFLPHPGQCYEWQCAGALEFAALHFLDAELLPVKRLLRSTTWDPRVVHLVRHPLTAALLRQIITLLEVHDGAADADGQAFVQRMLSFLIDDCIQAMERPPRSRPSEAALSLSPLQGWLRTHLNKPIGPTDMAQFLGISENQLQQKLRQQLNLTASQYLRKLRLQHARSLLADTQLTLGQIASECGYDSQSHFTTSFSQAMGISPGRYRRALQDIHHKQRHAEAALSPKEPD